MLPKASLILNYVRFCSHLGLCNMDSNFPLACVIFLNTQFIQGQKFSVDFHGKILWNRTLDWSSLVWKSIDWKQWKLPVLDIWASHTCFLSNTVNCFALGIVVLNSFNCCLWNYLYVRGLVAPSMGEVCESGFVMKITFCAGNSLLEFTVNSGYFSRGLYPW